MPLGKTLRLDFAVRPEVRALFESLRERIGADSLTEILRRAVATFEWHVALRMRGAKLYAINPDGSTVHAPDPCSRDAA